MHWVDRGPEPAGLKKIRSVHTPPWVRYYKTKVGRKPTDSYWLRYRADIESVFQGLCAYCEVRDGREVDHFRPKSKFPHMVYSWSNWLLACHGCNHSKGSKWPVGGYVDPCTSSKLDSPEQYFIFDTKTGSILPNGSLTTRKRQKAQRTIKRPWTQRFTTPD